MSTLYFSDIWNRISSSRKGSRKSISEISTRLPAIAGELDTIFKNVEPQFLQTGQQLQSVFSDAAILAQDTVKTVKKFSNDSDESLLDSLEGLVRKSVSGLHSANTEISLSVENIDAGAEYLGKLYTMCSEIEKTALFLQIVGLNIGIESSRSEDSRDMFEAFVHEIKKLVWKMNEIAEGIRDGAKEAMHNQSSARHRITEGLTTIRSLTDAAETSVKTAVEEIDLLMKRSFLVLEKVESHSREISRQAGEIVMAIQFNDITRQQIEHVISALKDVEELLKESIVSDYNGNDDYILGRACSILSLQVDHLGQVISEIDIAHQKSMQGFGEIGIEVRELVRSVSGMGLDREDVGDNELRELIRSVSTMDLDGEVDEAAEDPFAKLRYGIKQLHELIIHGHDLGMQMREAAEQSSEASSNLSSHVEQVSGIGFELHLKGLNAIVKSTHLGNRYEALEVLSREVKRLSNESNGFVDDVVEILGAVTGLAKELGKMSPKKAEETPGKGKQVGVALDEGLKQISYAFDKFKDNSKKAHKSSQSLWAAVSQAKNGLNFLPDMSFLLTELMEELEKISHDLKADGVRETELSREEIEEVGRVYTMEKERDIAFKHLVSTPGGGREQEDAGENIELFGGDSGSLHYASDDKIQEEGYLGNNVDLF